LHQAKLCRFGPKVLKSTVAPVQEQTADDLALDEVESNFSVDEDAVPARKVIINNQVSQSHRYSFLRDETDVWTSQTLDGFEAVC